MAHESFVTNSKGGSQGTQEQVKGYNKLTPGQIDDMNLLKDKEAEVLKLIKNMYPSEQNPRVGGDARCLALALTQIQQAFMWANRAIAKPREDF